MSWRKKLNLTEDEDIVERIQPTLLRNFWNFFAGILVLVAGAFFAFWLLSQGASGGIVLAVIGFTGLVILTRAWAASRKNYWIITTERLIDIEKRGLLDQTISSSALREIKDVSVRQKGFGARFFNYGDITVEIFSDSYVLTLHGVKEPRAYADRIIGISRACAKKTRSVESQAILRNFYRILPSLDAVQLNEARNLIDNALDEFAEESSMEAE